MKKFIVAVVLLGLGAVVGGAAVMAWRSHKRS